MNSSEEAEDATIESFKYEAQAAATKHNRFSLLTNPSAEPGLLYRVSTKQRAKMVRKSSAQLSTAVSSAERIQKLIRKVNCSTAFEEQITSIVQLVLHKKLISRKKLEALVAAAVYLVHRLNNAEIYLSQLLKVYQLRSADISKCLSLLKKQGLAGQPQLPNLCSLYFELVNQWLPYSRPDSMPTQPRAAENEQAFRVYPSPELASGLFEVLAPKVPAQQKSPLSLRERIIRVGRCILNLPEIKFASQGKLPQTTIAGTFLIAAEYCEMQIAPAEIAAKLGISASTVNIGKRRAMQVLLAQDVLRRGKQFGASEAAEPWSRTRETLDVLLQRQVES